MKSFTHLVIALAILLVAPSAFAIEIVSIDSVNVTVRYVEPTENTDGSPITDLDHVNVFYDLGNGEELGITQPAKLPTGGQQVTTEMPVPISDGVEADVKFYARAVDGAGNASDNSSIVTRRIDRLRPGAPK